MPISHLLLALPQFGLDSDPSASKQNESAQIVASDIAKDLLYGVFLDLIGEGLESKRGIIHSFESPYLSYSCLGVFVLSLSAIST